MKSIWLPEKKKKMIFNSQEGDEVIQNGYFRNLTGAVHNPYILKSVVGGFLLILNTMLLRLNIKCAEARKRGKCD